jgi:hypothetical protein
MLRKRSIEPFLKQGSRGLSVPQLVLRGLKQVPPTTDTTATIQISFDLLGILPDIVQIYAENAAGTDPANLADTIDINPTENQYTEDFTLLAGTYYTIYACPRTKTNGVLDDQIDGEYWETYCVSSAIVTQEPATSGGNLPPPIISKLDPEPATITQGNSITVTWSSSVPYFKIHIGGTENGRAINQQEFDFPDPGSSSGSWTVSTIPEAHYTFNAQGGSGLGGDTWSHWGPTVKITASPNLTSLKQILQHSGINIAGQHLRQLMPSASGGSLRKFMQL